MSVVAETLSVSRSNLHDRLTGNARPRRRYLKAKDAVVVPLITALVAARPTYGYRRITAILNRKLRAESAEPVNHKRVYRIMRGQNLLLARRYTERSDRAHNGKVVTLRSNLRWCSDGFVPLGTSPCDALPVRGSLAGTATSSAAPSSSTPTTARSSPGALSRTRASADRTSAT